jgi:uncharacterized protein (DUF433 family)
MKLDRISSNPAHMNGQPCMRDLRLTVRRVVELVALYPDREDLRREFPELQDEDIRQALTYAAANLDDRVIELARTHETSVISASQCAQLRSSMSYLGSDATPSILKEYHAGVFRLLGYSCVWTGLVIAFLLFLLIAS